MWVDTEVSLAEVDENGDGKNGVRVKVAERNFVVIKHFVEEGMNRNSKATEVVIFKHYELTGPWIRIVFR